MDLTLLLLALAVGGFLGIGGTCWVFLKVLQLLTTLLGQGRPPINSAPGMVQGIKALGAEAESRLMDLERRPQIQQRRHAKGTSSSSKKRRKRE